MGLLGAAVSAASSVAGAISGGSKQPLKKLTIQVEGDNATYANPFQDATTIVVMFNPIEIVRSHTATWATLALLNGTPTLRFTSTPLDTLTGLKLIFDTTETKDNVTAGEDVRKYTNDIVGLARIRPRWHRPPLCQLSWGDGYNGDQWFEGVATKVDENFTWFSGDGKPLRATLTCAFQQWNPAQTSELQSTDVHKSHVVKRGDTLHSIARERLHDPAMWRIIAAANNITDPLALEPGRVLHVPTVTKAINDGRR